MVSAAVLLVFIALLPGIVASWVFNILTGRRTKDTFERVRDALVFELASVILFAGLCRWWNVQPGALDGVTPDQIKAVKDGRVISVLIENAGPLLVLGLSTMLVGVIPAIAHVRDFPLALLRKWRLTRASAWPTVWESTFRTNNAWAVVHLKSGSRIQGWVELYPDDPKHDSVFVREAVFLSSSPDGVPVEVDGPGVLILPSADIQLIQFTRGSDEPRQADPSASSSDAAAIRPAGQGRDAPTTGTAASTATASTATASTAPRTR